MEYEFWISRYSVRLCFTECQCQQNIPNIRSKDRRYSNPVDSRTCHRINNSANYRAYERPYMEPPWQKKTLFPFRSNILPHSALLVMPNSPVLWVAAGMLWIMDASINISMEPFRAFVGDMLSSGTTN